LLFVSRISQGTAGLTPVKQALRLMGQAGLSGYYYFSFISFQMKLIKHNRLRRKNGVGWPSI